MSILSTIKQKILTVQNDISTSSLLPFNVNIQVGQKVNHEAEIHAGDAYLSWCQGHWSEMHRESEKNALKAQAVDSLVVEVAGRLDRQHAALSLFVRELAAFSDLADTMCSVQRRVSELSRTCGELESMLVILDDTCDELQQLRNRREHEAQLSAYRERKHLELEHTKLQLAKKHATNVQHSEQQVSAALKERQQVFEEAFIQQMQTYKASRRIRDNAVESPVVFSLQSDIVVVDLADIVVDEDTSLLNDFLDSTDDPITVTNVPLSSAVDQEGDFIIDDTTDVTTVGVTAAVLQDADCLSPQPNSDSNDTARHSFAAVPAGAGGHEDVQQLLGGEATFGTGGGFDGGGIVCDTTMGDTTQDIVEDGQGNEHIACGDS